MSDEQPCARCSHPESSHLEGGECMRCTLLLVDRSKQDEPCKHYEPPLDPRRTYLSAHGRVYSPEPGTRLEMPGGRFYVASPCAGPDAEVMGEWVCVSHLVRMPTTALKDYHCFHRDAPGGGDRAKHLLVWNCYLRDTGGRQHGPERAGPPGWRGEDKSGEQPLYPQSVTDTLR